MMLRAFPIPDLPIAWPYAPRPALPALDLREGVQLPGLDGRWTLLSPKAFQIPSSSQGLPEAFGRGGVARAEDIVLRPYRRGGLLRRINSRGYATPRRFQRELLIHRALWQTGFPTVAPVGCAYRRWRGGFEGIFLTRFQAGVPWPRDWTRQPSLLPSLAEALRALDAWGLRAPDLNATNVLLLEAGGLICLDWDRAAFTARAGTLMQDYHRRLRRSLVKLEAPQNLLDAFDAILGAGRG